MRRGRPPYPGILTPREQEVLDLLREGLSNPELAGRLGITRAGAAYHVSEILSKLQVHTREEAAAWKPRPEPVLGIGTLGVLWQKVRLPGLAKATVVAALTAGVGAIVVLALGVLMQDSTPAPGQPSHAPDGRTGEPGIDRIIDALVQDDAASLVARFEDVEARLFVENGERDGLASAQWTARFTVGDRELFAVYEGGNRDFSTSAAGGVTLVPRDLTVVVRLTPPDGMQEVWRFGVNRGLEPAMAAIEVATGRPYDVSRPAPASTIARMPWVVEEYARYLVLPAQEALPARPGSHDLSVRTGGQGMDELLALLEARDVAGLLDAVTYERMPCGGEAGTPCGTAEPGSAVEVAPVWGPARGLAGPFVDFKDRTDLQALLTPWFETAVAVHAIATLPDGYEPAPGSRVSAEHMLIVVSRHAPLRWDTIGLLERDGQIVGARLGTGLGGEVTPSWRSDGVIDGLVAGGGAGPDGLYPTSFIAPPPDGGWTDGARDYVLAPPKSVADLEPSRESGVPAIDAFLQAINAGEYDTATAMLDSGMQRLCWESSPLPADACLEGETTGTIVDVMPVYQCNTRNFFREEVVVATQTGGNDGPGAWVLYAVTQDNGGHWAIFTGAPSSFGGELVRFATWALRFEGDRVTAVLQGCDNIADATSGNDGLPWPQKPASFLLAPPGFVK
jgi:DNA-binding CsgD family transcriptional regulator